MKLHVLLLYLLVLISEFGTASAAVKDWTYHPYAVDLSTNTDEFKIFSEYFEWESYAVYFLGETICQKYTMLYENGEYLFLQAVHHEGVKGLNITNSVFVDIMATCSKEVIQKDTPEYAKMLNAMINKYMKIPKRLSTSEKYRQEDGTRCVDEAGFKISYNGSACYFSAFVVDTANHTEIEMRAERPYNFAGLMSVNRFVNTPLVPFPFPYHHLYKNVSFTSYHTNIPSILLINNRECLRMDAGVAGSCRLMLTNIYYASMCCCTEQEPNCIMRTFEDPHRVCAIGNYSADFDVNSRTLVNEKYSMDYPADVVPHTNVTYYNLTPQQYKETHIRDFCTIRYKYSDNRISYEMPSPLDLQDCNQQRTDYPFCTYSTFICPHFKHNESIAKREYVVDCCCQDSDMCNADVKFLKFRKRFTLLRNNPVCYDVMYYSMLFSNSFTLEGDGKQIICSDHYDPVRNGTVFLAGNNMELMDSQDQKIYKSADCAVIPVILKPGIEDKCDHYIKNDTRYPRPLFYCGCLGGKLGEASDGTFCDSTMDIGKLYDKYKEELMPHCYVTNRILRNVTTGWTLADIESEWTRQIADDSVFCYVRISYNFFPSGNSDNYSTYIQADVETGIARDEIGMDAYKKYRERPSTGWCNTTKGTIVAYKSEACYIQPLKTDDIKNKMYRAIKDRMAIRTEDCQERYCAGMERMWRTQCHVKKPQRKAYMRDCTHPWGCFWTVTANETEKVAGCISDIDSLDLGTADHKSASVCETYSTNNRLEKSRIYGEAKIWDPEKDSSKCFATGELTASKKPIVVCCCTELDKDGLCPGYEPAHNMGLPLKQAFGTEKEVDEPWAID